MSSTNHSHAELMLRKKAEIAMQKYTLYVERTKLQRENGIARCSGDEESYDLSLAQRRNYRRAVKNHIKNGGWCFRVRGKNVADLRHGWWTDDDIIDDDIIADREELAAHGLHKATQRRMERQFVAASKPSTLDPVENDEFETETETISFWGSNSRPIVWADDEYE